MVLINSAMLSEIDMLIFILSKIFNTKKPEQFWFWTVIAWMYIGRKSKWIMKNHELIASEINMLNLNIPKQRLSFGVSNHKYFVLACFSPALCTPQTYCPSIPFVVVISVLKVYMQ